MGVTRYQADQQTWWRVDEWVVDRDGRPFMDRHHPMAELAPRDVVARAIHRQIADGKGAFLDARHIRGLDFARRFPAITALCRESGIDPVTQTIPIRPAVHYHMGGILVDQAGRTSVDGLWACGEVACTGLHGANRLASIIFPFKIAHGSGAASAEPLRETIGMPRLTIMRQGNEPRLGEACFESKSSDRLAVKARFAG